MSTTNKRCEQLKKEKLEINPDYDSDDVWGNHEKSLNKLVNDHNINNPYEVLFLMNLIDNHNIKTEKGVLESLEEHKNGGCDKDNCDQVMKSSLDKRVDMMYKAQLDEWGFYKYSEDTCKEYLYDLFTRKSLDGDTMESKAVVEVQKLLNYIDVEKAISQADNKYAVDLVVKTNKGNKICGIQVKPESYNFDESKESELPYQKFYNETDKLNKNKNKKYDSEVYYLKYNDDEEFTNLNEIKNKIDNRALELAK